jgi:hypothetical protein
VREVTSPQVPRSVGEGLDEMQASEAGALSLAFRRITDGLFRAQVDYDVVDDVALREARVEDGKLRVNDLAYGCLVVPPGGLSEEARGLARRLQEQGLQVVHARGDGAPEEALQFATVQLGPPSDQITVARRRCEGGDLFFVVNEGAEKYEGTVVLPVSGRLSHWDLGAGQVDEWEAEAGDGETRVAVRLLGGSAGCFGVEEG